MPLTYEQKLAMLAENKDFAIFNELSSLNDSLKDLIGAVESSKSEVVSVDNLADAKTDLTPLERNFEALKGSVEAVTKAIQAIPEDKEMDMSGVEKLLEQIAGKEMDMSHMMAMSGILDNILFAVQTTASHSNEKEEELAPDLKKIQEILNLLNENIVAIEIPGFDYLRLAQIIKDNVKISGGGGINPAPQINAKLDELKANQSTEITHLSNIESNTSQLVQSVENALSATSYDLNAAAYSATTAIITDYELDSVALDFSTTQSKTITVTTAQGTKLYEDTNTIQNLVISLKQFFNASENITVAVTQTAGACLLDLRMKIVKGSNTLAGTPSVKLQDGYGNPIKSLNGAINIHDADVHRSWIFHFFTRTIATFTLATQATAGDTQLTLNSVVGLNVGDYLHVDSPNDHVLLKIISLPGGNVVNIDRPIDITHAIGTSIEQITPSCNESGTLASPKIYQVVPKAGEVYHITKVKMAVTDNIAMDYSTFGGISALTNGVLFRRYDGLTGIYSTFFNSKRNGDFIIGSDDHTFETKVGGGEYSFDATLDAHSLGTIFYLNGTNGDRLEIWVQDNLTALSSLIFTTGGHIENE